MEFCELSTIQAEDLQSLRGALEIIASAPDEFMAHVAFVLAAEVLQAEEDRRRNGGPPRVRVVELTDAEMEQRGLYLALSHWIRVRDRMLAAGHIGVADFFDCVINAFGDVFLSPTRPERETAAREAKETDELERLFNLPSEVQPS